MGHARLRKMAVYFDTNANDRSETAWRDVVRCTELENTGQADVLRKKLRTSQPYM